MEHKVMTLIHSGKYEEKRENDQYFQVLGIPLRDQI